MKRSDSTVGHNVEVSREGFRLFEVADLDALVALYGKRAEIWHPEGWPEPGPTTGRGAIRRQFQTLREGWSEHQVIVEQIEGRDDWVVARVRWQARGGESGADVELTLLRRVAVRGRADRRGPLLLGARGRAGRGGLVRHLRAGSRSRRSSSPSTVADRGHLRVQEGPVDRQLARCRRRSPCGRRPRPPCRPCAARRECVVGTKLSGQSGCGFGSPNARRQTGVDQRVGDEPAGSGGA